MKKRILKIALDRLDRHVPFFMDGVTAPDGVELQPLEVGLVNPQSYRDGADRHGRMFRDNEFDICEQSLASYIVAKSRGDTSLTATPVFPRRLFSQICMFVNVDAGIDTPRDLIGKRVGINSFQTTLCVLAKGDLKFEYGVPWEDIHWFLQREEELPWQSDAGISLQKIPAGKDAAEMLVEGELDAYFHPSPPPLLYARTDRVGRLFPDSRRESIRYFNKLGYCPIMHIMVFPQRMWSRRRRGFPERPSRCGSRRKRRRFPTMPIPGIRCCCSAVASSTPSERRCNPIPGYRGFPPIAPIWNDSSNTSRTRS